MYDRGDLWLCGQSLHNLLVWRLTQVGCVPLFSSSSKSFPETWNIAFFVLRKFLVCAHAHWPVISGVNRLWPHVCFFFKLTGAAPGQWIWPRPDNPRSKRRPNEVGVGLNHKEEESDQTSGPNVRLPGAVATSCRWKSNRCASSSEAGLRTRNSKLRNPTPDISIFDSSSGSEFYKFLAPGWLASLKTIVLFARLACPNKLCLLNGNSNFRLRPHHPKVFGSLVWSAVSLHIATNARWHIATNSQWHIATNLQWYIATNSQWQIATNSQWHIATKSQWHIATNLQWHIATNLQWHIATSSQWRIATRRRLAESARERRHYSHSHWIARTPCTKLHPPRKHGAFTNSPVHSLMRNWVASSGTSFINTLPYCFIASSACVHMMQCVTSSTVLRRTEKKEAIDRTLLQVYEKWGRFEGDGNARRKRPRKISGSFLNGLMTKNDPRRLSWIARTQRNQFF